MNQTANLILGIDTSNYKTSVAVVDSEKKIRCDLRKLLRVKQGERGLRQSDALFQHLENLPALLEEAFADGRADDICAVCSSDRPRPVKGSYMPVFKAGMGFGQAVAAALQVPYYTCSHQEGHIEAIRAFSEYPRRESFLCYHLSGGTSELLEVRPEGLKIIGGTKDLSFGQVLDRIGVRMGMRFPAGEELDRIALSAKVSSRNLKKIPSEGLYFNLSGIETQCRRRLEVLEEEGKRTEPLVRELFDRMVNILIEVTETAAAETGLDCVLFAGGVSSSRYVRQRLEAHFGASPLSVAFGRPELSQDNAVGTALLGGKKVWR